jgi:hypothetical protein
VRKDEADRGVGRSGIEQGGIGGWRFELAHDVPSFVVALEIFTDQTAPKASSEDFPTRGKPGRRRK